MPAVAAEDPLLAQMTGDWIGRGTFKSSPTAKPEMVYCKINNKLGTGGATLQQKGRCAVATNSGRISGTFVSKGGGAYQGSLQSLSTKGPTLITGKALDNQIAFQAKFVDRASNRPLQSAIQLIFGDGSYRLVSTMVSGGADFVSSDIKFTKK